TNSFTHFSTPNRPPPRSTLFPYTTLFRSQELHDEVDDAAALADAVDRDDAGVLKLGRGAGLALEALDELFVEGEGKRQDLDGDRSEEHTSELQSRFDIVCRLLLEKKKKALHEVQNLARIVFGGGDKNAQRSVKQRVAFSVQILIEKQNGSATSASFGSRLHVARRE